MLTAFIITFIELLGLVNSQEKRVEIQSKEKTKFNKRIKKGYVNNDKVLEGSTVDFCFKRYK